MNNKLINSEGLNEVLKLVKKDIYNNNTNIENIKNIIGNYINVNKLKSKTNKETIIEMIDELYDSISSKETNWNDIKDKPQISSKIELNNDGLQLVDSEKRIMSTVNILSAQEISDLLNQIN